MFNAGRKGRVTTRWRDRGRTGGDSESKELQPHLIVLDIGLPSLNGSEVARRIRKLLPESKILFVSQETSALLAQEAFHLGASGYVVKERAASELLVAVDAVCQGRRFVSKGLSLDRAFVDAFERQAPDPCPTEELPLFTREAENTRRHEVQFCPDDASLVGDFTCFIKTALGSGMQLSWSRPSRTGIASWADCRHPEWMLPRPSHGEGTSPWMLPRRYRGSW